MLRLIFLFILGVGILTIPSCGLLPYSENFACEKGKTAGYCGSITSVYKQVNQEEIQ